MQTISGVIPNLLIFLISFSSSANQSLKHQEENDFITSFINNYGFEYSARNTHEYHPFILAKTRDSFKELEEYLARQSFQVQERMVICGFQGDAIPSYYTFDDCHAIHDEKSQKDATGLPLVSENLFGYMTGFLLKDIAFDNTANNQGLFRFITGKQIGLFDPQADLFHRHAFGDAYAIMHYCKKAIKKALLQQDAQALLSVLYQFWRYIYTHDTYDGQRKAIATQDILFSLYYAQHLINSQARIANFFIGSDITYPIEVLRCQNSDVTLAAQNFLPILIDALVPKQNQPTAYIFCSFVDGVGKSTLTGNIKNWMSYGSDFAKYQRVDNSSSQQASLFSLKDNVWLVDLPAQVSHFTLKPDGFVYVDIDTVPEISMQERQEIQRYVADNSLRLVQAFDALLATVASAPDMFHESDSMETCYAKQCVLMGNTQQVRFVAFSWNGASYLVDRTMPNSIKLLQPLDGVHSYGLKELNPEQMIFSKGVTAPCSYETFLNDLREKLHAVGVKNIVFVDFISMYPRTSRENIRVNYLMQELKQLFGTEYQQEYSLYTAFIHPQEVYGLLHNHRKELQKSLVQETIVRYLLYRFFEDGLLSGSVDCATVHTLLKQHYQEMMKQYGKRIEQYVNSKMIVEHDSLSKQYAYDKNFQAIVSFDVHYLIAYSLFMQRLCTQQVKDPYLNALWASPYDNESYEQIYSFDPVCKDATMLGQVIRFIRVHWYQTIMNLLFMDNEWRLKRKPLCVAPVIVVQSQSGMIQIMRKRLHCLTAFDATVSLPSEAQMQFWSQFPVQWVLFDGKLHPLDNQAQRTDFGIYCYGMNSAGDKLLSKTIQELKEHPHCFVSSSHLAVVLQKNRLFGAIVKEEKQARQASLQFDFCGAKEPTQLALRALATLEMIAPDPQADCMVRAGNKGDFVACLRLLEHLTLKIHGSNDSKTPIFSSYESVIPVIPGLFEN